MTDQETPDHAKAVAAAETPKGDDVRAARKAAEETSALAVAARAMANEAKRLGAEISSMENVPASVAETAAAGARDAEKHRAEASKAAKRAKDKLAVLTKAGPTKSSC